MTGPRPRSASRPRPRSRSRSTRVLPAVFLLAVVLLCGATVLPAASYSTADVDRGASLGVVDDPDAVVGLVTADAVRVNATSELVVVTNQLGSGASVTLTLDSTSGSMANLVVDGTDVGTEYTTTIQAGESRQIDVSVDDDPTYVGEGLVFDVSADGEGIDATVSDRRTTIEGDSE